MISKGNLVDNWEQQYNPLKITYTENVKNPVDLAEQCTREFLYEDLRKYLPHSINARILECGCGGARNSLYLALHGFQVTCTDFSPEALRLAQANFAAFGAQGTFLLDDLMNSQLAPDSFDCVMSFGLLEHFEELGPLVANLTRLVKPGGIQIHSVIAKKFSTNTIANFILFPYRFLDLAIRKRDFRNIVRRSYRDFPHYENSFSWQEYARAFEKEGNEIIQCEPREVMLPLVHLPLRIGNVMVKCFHRKLYRLFKRLNRTKSRLLYLLAPEFCIICRKI